MRGFVSFSPSAFLCWFWLVVVSCTSKSSSRITGGDIQTTANRLTYVGVCRYTFLWCVRALCFFSSVLIVLLCVCAWNIRFNLLVLFDIQINSIFFYSFFSVLSLSLCFYSFKYLQLFMFILVFSSQIKYDNLLNNLYTKKKTQAATVYIHKDIWML